MIRKLITFRETLIRTILVLLVFIATLQTITAQQGQANFWYFGNNCAVDFNSGIPVGFSGSALNTFEGCASISNPQGELLFYTDGITVWDSTNSIMPNGNNLLGDPSSTQSGIIVQRPGSNNEYYIFAADYVGGNDGISYSRVDMNLNGGLGDVITSDKNTPMFSPAAEKITAVRHQNNVDIWIIAHGRQNDEFRAYLVTPTSVNLTPVITNIGTVFAFNDDVGYLKASPSGEMLACANATAGIIDLLSFDRSTGSITSLIAAIPVFAAYGVEFSPDESNLYGMAWNGGFVLQWDITSGNQTSIINSENQVGNMSGGGALQLGPDNKIYLTKNGSFYLGAINDPNVYGPGSNYIDTAVFLTSAASFGLPNFFPSFFNVSFSVTNICIGDSTFFSPDTTNVDSLKWLFDDPNSGVNNTSTDFFPFHIFTDTGTFNVRLIAFSDSLIDTSFNVFQILPIPTLDLGNDTALCNTDSLIKYATFPGASYLWNDSSSADSIIIDSSGTYYVTLTHACGVLMDSIEVEYDSPLSFDLGPDTLLCASAGYAIDPQLPVGHNATYLWHDNSTTSTFTATQTDTVTLTATNGCGPVSDTIIVTILPLPNPQLPNDTIACFDVPFTLNHNNIDSITYFWSDSTSAPTFTVDSSGVYWLAATNNCGTSIDSIIVVYQDPILLELGPDTSICKDDTIVLNAAFPGATYEWHDGSTDSIHLATETGTYAVEVTIGSCSVNDNVNVTIDLFSCFDSIDCIVVVPNVFTPNGDGQNDLLLVTTTCLFGDFTLSIFNRWGQKVYEADHENIGWDGTVNGIPAQEGVYFWIIDFRDEVVVDVDRQGKTGSLTIVR